MLMIEHYPAENNPNKDSITDVPATLNMNLARQTTQLAAIALGSLARLQTDTHTENE
jgi:hypothetical protein